MHRLHRSSADASVCLPACPLPVYGCARSRLGTSLAVLAGPRGPCDIYDDAGTPCVAAHSTVRALYGGYTGPVYQVRRASDNATQDVGVLAAGGVANSSEQDKFCESTDCIISRIFDQSPRLNHLDLAFHRAGGGFPSGLDKGVNARKLKLSVGGHSVYGAYFEKQMGYRNANTTGIATGDEPESMYMVTGGKTYNKGCCFDYGNAETSEFIGRPGGPPCPTNSDGHPDCRGAMEAISFSNVMSAGWTNGTGSGPWVRADLEDGIWAGNQTTVNELNTPIDADYVTAMLKGDQTGGHSKVEMLNLVASRRCLKAAVPSDTPR
jgi:hypothetical protein